MMKNYIFKKKTGTIALMISVFSIFLYRYMLTDTGIGYMACSYLICALVWCVLGEGLSDVTARMVRAKLAKGQKNNAMNILSVSFVNQLVLGIAGAVLCSALNFSLMSGMIGLPKGRFLGLYLSAFFFFRMLNEYFYGYVSVSSGERAIGIASILRELFRVISGLIFMNMMYDKGVISAALLMDPDLKYIYAVAGLFIGFSVSELLIFIFMFIVRLGSRIKSVSDYDSYAIRDNVPRIFFNIWKKRTGSIVHGMAFCIFMIAAVSRAGDAAVLGLSASALFVPFAISSLVSSYSGTAASVSWVSTVRKNEKGLARSYFDFGVHIVVIASVFCTAFVASVSKLVNKVLITDPGVSLTTELILITAASIFFSIAHFCDQLCSMRDDRISRIISDAVSCLAAILAVRISSGKDHSFYMAFMISLLVYSVTNMIIWCALTYVRMGMVFDPFRNILLPVVSGAVTAIFLLLITNAAAAHLGNLFTMVMCIPIGLIIYHSVLLLLKNYTDSELKLMPFGNIIYSLGQILKVI